MQRAPLWENHSAYSGWRRLRRVDVPPQRTVLLGLGLGQGKGNRPPSPPMSRFYLFVK